MIRKTSFLSTMMSSFFLSGLVMSLNSSWSFVTFDRHCSPVKVFDFFSKVPLKSPSSLLNMSNERYYILNKHIIFQFD